jgi:hypothetical protein
MMNGWQHTGAFVVQFRAGSNLTAGKFEGRVEHVASCQAAHFHSQDELMAFMRRVIRDVQTKEAADTLADNLVESGR